MKMKTRVRLGLALLLAAGAPLSACKDEKSDLPVSGAGGSAGNRGAGGASGAGGSVSGAGGTAGAGRGGNSGAAGNGGSAGVDSGMTASDTGAETATSSDGSAAVGPERFVGDWDYQSGRAMLACPGATALTQDLVGTFLTFRAGAGVSPLILASPGCNLRFDIQGMTAVVQSGQTCRNPIAGRAAMSSPTAFTFTLGTGQTAQQSSSWTVTFADMPSAPCTLTNQGTLLYKPPTVR